MKLYRWPITSYVKFFMGRSSCLNAIDYCDLPSAAKPLVRHLTGV